MTEKFIIVGDIHLHLFNEFSKPASNPEYVNTRLEHTINALRVAFIDAKQTDATLILTGDLFHERGKVRTEVFNAAFNLLTEYSTVPVLMIRGNHDMVSNSLYSQSSVDIFDTLDNVTVIKQYDMYYTPEGNSIFGVSYGEEYAELKDVIKSASADILISHLGIEGAKGAGHSKLDGAFTVADLYPDNFKQVFLGHYHRAQELAPNVRYLGTLVSTNFSEPEKKGYWTVTMDNHEVNDLEFVPLNFPRFLTMSLSEYAELPEEERVNNYFRLTGTKEEVVKVEELTEVPESVRFDITREVTNEARIDIDATDTPITISEKWATDNDADHVDVIKQQMTKSLEGGH